MSLFDDKLWKENALFSVRETVFYFIGMLSGLLFSYIAYSSYTSGRPKSSTLCDFESIAMDVKKVDYERGIAQLNNVLVVNGGVRMTHCTNRETERLLKRARLKDTATLSDIVLHFDYVAPPFYLEKTNDSTFYVHKFGDTLTFKLACEN